VIFKKKKLKLFYIFLLLKKLVNKKNFPVNEKHFPVKKNLAWFLRKYFPFILGGKHFLKVVKNLEISYYLLIISKLVLKLLITIYILFWIFVFQFHPLEFNFYINFGPHFYNCYLLFPYYFFIKMFYLSNLFLILFIVTYFYLK